MEHQSRHPDPLDLTQTTLAVLAGGEGSRMGKPKGQLLVHGRPILAHLLAQLKWPGLQLLITAPGRENPNGWHLFDREVSDPVAGEGPLRGVLTALEHASTDIVVVTTVDMPGIAHHHLAWLARQLIDRPEAAAVMLFRDQPDSVEPFPCALRPSLATHVRSQLADGRRSVQGLLNQKDVELLPAPSDWEHATWSNLNYPADVAAFCRGASQ